MLGLLVLVAGLSAGVRADDAWVSGCTQGAGAGGGDPNGELDAFLSCVLAGLDKVPAADKQVLDLKSELEAIENLPLETNRERKQTNNVKRSLTKRQAEEEGRGWKNKDKKNKKDKKKNKKDKKRKKIKLEELELPMEAHEEEEVVKEVEDEGETADSPAEAPFTSGLQFSAYSRQPQPTYQQPHQQKFLYGLDSQGNAQYMDSEAVAEVLQTPQAMKAMMAYLSNAQDRPEQDTPIPSRLQEHFRPPAPRQPLWHLGGRPAQERRPLPERPPPAQRPLLERSSLKRPSQGPPRMQFFGPGDYVPELAHHVQGGVVRLQGGGQRRQDVFPQQNDQPALKLEPKPR